MKELLALQGLLSYPSKTNLLRSYIGAQSTYTPHALDNKNHNVWRKQKQKIADKVHALADTSQGKIAIIGHSLGGLHGAEVAFENPDEVDEIITLFAPILLVGRKTQAVAATAIYSSLDKLVRYPLGGNPSFDKNIDYKTFDHSAPLYTRKIHELVIVNLKLGAKHAGI